MGLTISIGHHLKVFANEQPNKTAIYFEDNEITYREFYNHVCHYESTLKQLVNTKEPQKVALLIGNEPDFLSLFFAITRLGWVSVPFDPKWSKREAESIMFSAKPDLVITNERFLRIADFNFSGAYLIEDMKSNDNPVALEYNHVSSNDLFYLGFTSGSTGAPKGFIRNQQSWLSSFTAGEEIFQYDKEDTLLAPGPLCHGLSLFGAIHALHIGASLILMKKFSVKKTFEMINSLGATVLYAVPTMLNGLARLSESTNKEIIILSSGAKLAPLIKQNIKAIFPNSNIFEYYGASELSFATYATEEMIENDPNSVGIPFPGVQISIRNAQGNKQKANEIGSIYIKSDLLFSHYVNNELATNEVLTRHGAQIGDTGFLNDEGMLTIIGREHNMIISGGQNVYPEEVEMVIKELNTIKDVVVLGINDDHWGQVLIAIISWKNNVATNKELAHVRRYCQKHLSTYKRPRKYYVVEELPYTLTGKVARNEITANLTKWTT